MNIAIDKDKLLSFLERCPDAEAIGVSEYVLDLYDVSEPVSLDIVIGAKGASVLAARRMAFDEEQDGWYLTEEIEELDLIVRLLHEAMDVPEEG